MMEYLVLWFGTSFISFLLQVIKELRIYKDIANEGYKINTSKLSFMNNKISPDCSKISFMIMLIPGFNIFSALNSVLNYNKTKSLNYLKKIDVLEEMTDDEKREYVSSSTGLKAYSINYIDKTKSLIHAIKINDEFLKSEITYKIDDDGDITVLNVLGDLADLSLEEQKHEIMEIWRVFFSINKDEIRCQDNIGDSKDANLEIDIETEVLEDETNESKKLNLLQTKKQLLKQYKINFLELSNQDEQIQTNVKTKIKK